MKNGKYSNGKKSLNMKPLAVLLALTLLVGCAVGGTIAWLTATTEEVENTFTIGNINIDLDETATDEDGKKNYNFVPGQTLDKDPKVIVTYGSEDCYLFIKIKEENNTCTDLSGNIINWTVRGQETNPVNTNSAAGWVKYKEETATGGKYYYYYRTVTKTADPNENDAITGADYPILVNDKVSVNPQVTKGMVTAIKKAEPALSFWAAAVQSANLPAATAPETAVDVAFDLITWPAET